MGVCSVLTVVVVRVVLTRGKLPLRDTRLAKAPQVTRISFVYPAYHIGLTLLLSTMPPGRNPGKHQLELGWRSDRHKYRHRQIQD